MVASGFGIADILHFWEFRIKRPCQIQIIPCLRGQGTCKFWWPLSESDGFFQMGRMEVAVPL